MTKLVTKLVVVWVMLFLIAFALFNLPFPSSVYASVNAYYVSASGSDSNDGSQAHPWLTLSHADSAAVLGSGGTTIHVGDGTYSFAGSVLNLNKGGTSDSVRMVWQCDNQSNATMTWPCLLRGGDGGTGVNINGTYTNFVGFDYSGNALYAVGTSTNYTKFLNNRIHDVNGTCAVVGGAGIVMGSNSHDGFVIANWIFNVTPSTPSGTVSGHCHGIYNIASNTTIENNVIFNNPNGIGIKYEPSATYTQSFGIISNNTFWGNGRATSIGGGGLGGCVYITGNPSGGSPSNMSLNNNICYKNVGADIGLGTSVPTSGGSFEGSSAHNNLMNGNGNQTVSGGIGTSLNIPNFTNFQADGSGDYTPTNSGPLTAAGSTVCASGTSICTPSVDFRGVTRSTPDIGAFQYGSVTPPGNYLPASVDFGTVNTGTTFNQDIKYTNVGVSSVTLNSATFTGADAALFSQTSTNSCGTLPVTVLANGSCVFHVGFSPVAVGSFAANFRTSDTSATTPHDCALSGAGQAPTVPATPTGLTAVVH